MASFTETVEDRNPALTATGLAIWGWIIRVVIFVAFLLIPHVITSVTPLVNYGGTVAGYAAQYPSLVWAGTHGQIIADATQYAHAARRSLRRTRTSSRSRRRTPPRSPTRRSSRLSWR